MLAHDDAYSSERTHVGILLWFFTQSGMSDAINLNIISSEHTRTRTHSQWMLLMRVNT